MKALKVLFVACAAFVGISAAVAGNLRVNNFIFVQQANGLYRAIPVTQYDQTKCIDPSTQICSLGAATDLTAGTPRTQAFLQSLGATVVNSDTKVYVP